MNNILNENIGFQSIGELSDTGKAWFDLAGKVVTTGGSMYNAYEQSKADIENARNAGKDSANNSTNITDTTGNFTPWFSQLLGNNSNSAQQAQTMNYLLIGGGALLLVMFMFMMTNKK